MWVVCGRSALLALLALLLLLAVSLEGKGGGLALGMSEFSDHKHHGHRILLQQTTIDTRSAPQIHQEQHPSPHFAGLSDDDLLDNEQRSVFLVNVSPNPVDRKSLDEYMEVVHHTKLVDYVPHNTFVVEVTNRQARELQQRDEVHWVGHLRPNNKVLRPPPLTSTNTLANSDDDTLSLVVSFVRQWPARSDLKLDELAVRIINELSRLKLGSSGSSSAPAVTPVYTQHNRVLIRFGSAKDRDDAEMPLASMPEVLRVEHRLAIHVKNKWAKGIVEQGASDAVHPDHLMSARHQLQGQGQIVGVADTGIDVHNCYFSDPGGPDPFVSFTPATPTSGLFNPDALANARKVASYVSYVDNVDSHGHGTHVCGSVAGYPQDDSFEGLVDFAGVAPHARLHFFDISAGGSLDLPDDVGNQMFEWAYQSGARIHSNSWGSSTASYTYLSEDFDEYMFTHKDFVILVAAGNDGDCGDRYTVGSPSTAKSCVSVGASMNNHAAYNSTAAIRHRLEPFYSKHPNISDEESIAYFSSIGPTRDGRIKPDVVAPGNAIVSAETGGGDCSSSLNALTEMYSGTSMATPVLAGAMAVARQYFTNGFYPTGTRSPHHRVRPSGSLLKAVIVAGAVPLRGWRFNQCSTSMENLAEMALPNVHEGWGRTQLNRVLEFAGESTFHMHIPSLSSANDAAEHFGDASLEASGETLEYRFCSSLAGSANSSSRSGGVRVALVWTDAPGSASSSVILVNDLDVRVTYAGRTWYGNGVSGGDRVNPVETVDLSIDVAAADDIVVTVDAAAINVAPQPFSLVVLGDVRAASCAHLTSGAHIRDGKRRAAAAAAQAPLQHLIDDAPIRPQSSIPPHQQAIMDPACQYPVTLSQPTAEISDHNRSVSDTYLSHQTCIWNVKVEKASSITFSFTAFDLGDSAVGSTDLLSVFGPKMSSVASLRGSNVPAPVCVNGNEAGLRLKTESQVTSTGFQAFYKASSYRCEDSAAAVLSMDEACSSPVSLEAPQGTISDHDHGESDAYANNQNCTWMVNITGTTSIRFEFEFFDLESNFDFLRFLNPSTGQTLHSLTGRSLPVPICIDNDTVHLNFHTDGSVVAGGFIVNYEASADVCPEPPMYMDPACESPVLLEAPSGIITDHNRSLGDNYWDHQSCIWNLNVQNAQSISFNFEYFHLEQRFDWLHVRKAVTGDNLASFSGSSTPSGFCVSGGAATLHFTTDYSVTYGGFILHYEAGDSPCPVDMDVACDCPVTLRERSGIITDHNRSSAFEYLPNQLCRWNLDVPSSSSIEFNFDLFNLEHGWDFLEFVDPQGNTLQKLSGHTLPEPVCVPGSEVSLVFTSDEMVAGLGFVVNYEGSHAPCPPAPSSYMDPACTQPRTIVDRTGTITDHNTSISPTYAPNQNCVWNVEAPCAVSYLITFTRFEFGPFDRLRLESSSESIDFTDIAPGYLPWTGCVESREFQLLMSTDSGVVMSGFHLEYEARHHPCEEAPFARIPSPYEACEVEGGARLHNRSGIIADHIASDRFYRNNMNCRWTVLPSTATASITFIVRKLQLEPTYDNLSIHAGADQPPPLDTSVSLAPQSVCINGSTSVVTFVTDQSIVSGGVVLEYRSSAQPCRA